MAGCSIKYLNDKKVCQYSSNFVKEKKKKKTELTLAFLLLFIAWNTKVHTRDKINTAEPSLNGTTEHHPSSYNIHFIDTSLCYFLYTVPLPVPDLNQF